MGKKKLDSNRTKDGGPTPVGPPNIFQHMAEALSLFSPTVVNYSGGNLLRVISVCPTWVITTNTITTYTNTSGTIVMQGEFGGEGTFNVYDYVSAWDYADIYVGLLQTNLSVNAYSNYLSGHEYSYAPSGPSSTSIRYIITPTSTRLIPLLPYAGASSSDLSSVIKTLSSGCMTWTFGSSHTGSTALTAYGSFVHAFVYAYS